MQGHIRKKDNSWQYTLDIGRDPETGKRKRKSKGGFKTKKECQIALAEIITSLEKGQYFEIVNISVENYMKKWLDEYAKNQVAYSTYKRYEGIIEKYINPKLGKIELSNLKPMHIQSFYNYCIDVVGNSTTTVKQYHSVIHKALKQGVKWQLINYNVADAVEKPKKAKTEMQVLDDVELNKLLNRIKGMTIYPLVLVAAHTGMRLGEVCGLTWDNIDLKEGIIYVKNQLQEINGSLELVPLKTKSSKRKIVLLNSTVELLKELRKKEINNVYYLNSKYQNNNFAITQGDGRPYAPQYISRNFRRIIKEYKIAEELNIPPIRFHDLRHTHATLLLKAGVNPKVVAERLGHSSISMTLNTYSHVLPGLQEDAASKLENLLKQG